MRESTRVDSLGGIAEFLQARGLGCGMFQDDILELEVLDDDLPARLFVRWNAGEGVVQFVGAYTFTIAPEHAGELDALVARLNRRLWYLGFTYDPTSRVVAYRVGFPLDQGAVDMSVAIGLLDVVSGTLKAYAPAFPREAGDSDAPSWSVEEGHDVG